MGVAAAYAAITSDAAVLYSETNALTTPTENRIRALAPRAIVLVGGSAALDTSLHARLRTLAPAATIHRISGSDRIDTAVRAADRRLTEIATDPPAAPTSLTVTARNAGLTVSWAAPTRTTDARSNDDPEITGYAIQYRACTAADRTCRSSERWDTWRSYGHSGTRTSATLSGLTNGTAYQVQVRARNSAGLGPWSPTATGTPLAQTAKPSVPSGFTVEAADRQIKVSWSPSVPPRDGTVSGYEVEYRSCSAGSPCGNWRQHSHSGTGTTTTITKLSNGISYEVRVQATSSRGNSGWSAAKSATPAQLPSFERPPTLEAGDRQILVQWNEPAPSGSPIRDYDVQYRACTATDSDTTDLTCEPDADPTWGGWKSRSHSGTAQSVKITNLTNGTAYQVQVRASNSNGAGPWSDAEKATPVSVPARPNPPTVEPGNAKLVVTWTAPSDNGSDITGYDVAHCTGTCASDSSDWDDTRVGATATRHVIGSLSNDTTYRVRVRAVNGIGGGPWSSTVSRAPKALPDAPDAPSLTPGDRKIDVSWSAPTSLHDTTVTGYDIRYRACTATPKDCSSNPRWGSWRSKGHPGTDPRELSITSLTNGTAYEVQVRARISGGVGPYSGAESTTPLGKPAKPATPRVTAGDGVLVVTWTAPADNGSAITDYKIEHCHAADCTVDGNWDEDTSLVLPTPDPVTGILTHTLSELTNDTIYRVRLLATNGVGDGPWSSTVSGKPTVRPGVPTDLTMREADRQVSLIWTEANPKGVPLTGYDIEYRACEATGNDKTVLTCEPDADATWGDWKAHTHTNTGMTTTIKNLTNGTKYEARVRARNANGPGPWSETASGIPLAAASAPTGLVVEAANEKLSVSWTASVARGSTITGYVMRYQECLSTPKSCTSNARWGGWTAHSVTDTSTTRTITGLTNGTKYRVQVQATSTVGDATRVSGWSQIKSATPAAVPDAPSSLTLAADDRQITVSWGEPADHDSAINDYDVEYRVCIATGADRTVLTCDPADEATWGSWLTHNHSGASRTTTITNLTNGTKHQVRVRARNANGVGPWSVPAPTDGERPVGAPAAPKTPRVTAGDATLTVSWIIPRSNGSVISGYDVWYRPCASTPSEFMVLSCASNPTWGGWVKTPVVGKDVITLAIASGLTNGTDYQVQVRAKTSTREGPWSSPVTAMPIGAPSAPTDVEVASGNRQLIVSWPAPSSNGSNVTGYKIRYCGTSGGDCDPSTGTDWVTRSVSGASRRSYPISSLMNGSEYTVQILTTSNKGDSDWETAVPATVMAGGPSQVSPPRLMPGSGSISVTWRAPAKNHSEISSYVVEHRACSATNSNPDVLTCASNPTWGDWSSAGVSFGDGTTATISGLTGGTRYQVRVRAVNTQGSGQWSSPALATPTS